MAALADGGRRLHELSSAAQSVGFSLEGARAEEAPPSAERGVGWTAYAPLEPEPAGATPPGGPGPPAPPATREPASPGPDPADPGPPIAVRLDDLLLGDLGARRADAQLLQALLLRDGHVGKWLLSQGIDVDAVERAFPGSGWS